MQVGNLDRNTPSARSKGTRQPLAVSPVPDIRLSAADGCSSLEGMMSTVDEIERAVIGLSAAELAAFRAWFAEFDAAAWDRQFAAGVAAGRLNSLAAEALQDLREGRCTDL
jgi:hypothetical protein